MPACVPLVGCDVRPEFKKHVRMYACMLMAMYADTLRVVVVACMLHVRCMDVACALHACCIVCCMSAVFVLHVCCTHGTWMVHVCRMNVASHVRRAYNICCMYRVWCMYGVMCACMHVWRSAVEVDELIALCAEPHGVVIVVSLLPLLPTLRHEPPSARYIFLAPSYDGAHRHPSISAPHQHRRRHFYCTGIAVPELKITASARAFRRCVAHAQRVPITRVYTHVRTHVCTHVYTRNCSQPFVTSCRAPGTFC